MADENWNEGSGVDSEKAKRLQAGVLKPSPVVEGLKSAWLGLKNSLSGDDKKSKPTHDEDE